MNATLNPATPSVTTLDLSRLRTPLPMPAVLRSYALEAAMELRSALRNPGFALPFILVPVAIYLLFGVVLFGNVGDSPEARAGVANYLFVGFSVLAVAMPGVFLCVPVATEREGRVFQLRRALPLPPGSALLAKVLMAMAVSAIALSLIVLLALALGTLTPSLTQVVIVWAVLVLGSIPFCALGLLLGTWCSAAAAPAWGNLLFLPMMWLSGLFIPLPDAFKPSVVLWPTFHLGQAAIAAADVEGFAFLPGSLTAGVLIGLTVFCGGLAVRRLARVG